jgi:hypothetical protein
MRAPRAVISAVRTLIRAISDIDRDMSEALGLDVRAGFLQRPFDRSLARKYERLAADAQAAGEDHVAAQARAQAAQLRTGGRRRPRS